MEDLLHRKISIYDNYFSNEPHISTLGNFLFDDSIRQKVDAIRKVDNKSIRDEMKKKLPCATISGIFKGGHSGENLVEHSGLLCIDIDAKDNPHITDWGLFKQQISAIRCVAFAALSVSARGVFLIILIPKCGVETHKRYFLALEEAFRKCGVKIDKNCKDISRLRGASYDDNYYFNPDATTFTNLPQPKPQPKPTAKMACNFDNDPLSTLGKVESCVSKICENKIDITNDYNDWIGIGFSLADLGEQGRKYFHAVSQFYQRYDIRKCDQQFDECLRSRKGKIHIGTFFHICKDYGIIPTPSPTPPQTPLQRITAKTPAEALLIDRLSLEVVSTI